MWKAQVIVIKKSIFYQLRFTAKYIFVKLHHLRFKTIISTDLGSSIVCVYNFQCDHDIDAFLQKTKFLDDPRYNFLVVVNNLIWKAFLQF